MVEPVSRRALLRLAAVVGLATGTAGCTFTSTGTATARASAGAEELAVAETIAQAGRLRDAALLASRQFASGTANRSLYTAIAADHAAHLRALGATPSTPSPTVSTSASIGSTASTSIAASGSPAGPPSPISPSSAAASAPGGPAEQQDAEWAAAGTVLRLGLDAQTGGLSQLLVRIAAARAAHADLIAGASDGDLPGKLIPPADPAAARSPSPAPSVSTAPTTTSTPSTSTAPAPGSVLATPTDRALNRLLAGEHAAVYAYPVVIARSTGARRRLAQQLWAQHRYERDLLVDRLLSAGIEPEASLAAYRISPIPTSPDQAAALAAKIERGLAALAADVVATAQPGTDRALGADQLVLAARRAARWAGRSDPLPGGDAPV